MSSIIPVNNPTIINSVNRPKARQPIEQLNNEIRQQRPAQTIDAVAEQNKLEKSTFETYSVEQTLPTVNDVAVKRFETREKFSLKSTEENNPAAIKPEDKYQATQQILYRDEIDRIVGVDIYV